MSSLICGSTTALDRFAHELQNFIKGGSASFDDLALQLFHLQSQSNLFYQRVLKSSNGSVDSMLHWQDIPCIPSVAFKEFDVTSIAQKHRTKVFHSSGTRQSGRSRHFHFDASIALYESSLLAWFKHHFTQINRHYWLHALTPSAQIVPDSSLVHMLDTLARSPFFCGTTFHGTLSKDGDWMLDAPRVFHAIHSAIDLGKPILLLGTAFHFVQFMDWTKQSGRTLHLPSGSCLMETGGYKGRSKILHRESFYDRLSDVFKMPLNRILSEYGMSELSSQAYDQRLGKGSGEVADRQFHFPPWVRVRIVSPENNEEVEIGETGIIQVFDLANVWSILAIQTEDLGRREKHGFRWIGRAKASASRGCSLMSQS